MPTKERFDVYNAAIRAARDRYVGAMRVVADIAAAANLRWFEEIMAAERALHVEEDR